MLLPGCARQGATGTTGKVTPVCGSLLASRLPAAWAVQLLGHRGRRLWFPLSAWGDSYPERCRAVSLLCTWEQPALPLGSCAAQGGSPAGWFSFPQLLPANM